MKEKEPSSIQTNVDSQDNENFNLKIDNEDVTAFKIVNNSPFCAIKYKGKWNISIGSELISYITFNEYEQLEEYINSKPWELILIASTIYSELYINYKKNSNK